MQKQNINVQSLTRQRKRIYFALTVFIPIAFLVCLEFSLRWFNYGVDLSLFGRQEIRGQIYYVMNPNVKSRYFGSMQFKPSISIHYFLVPKPQGVFRIFCLGGSTTVGYPYYFNASFPSFLDERLTALFPQKNIEIINLGITATNSYTTLDIARDLAECQPDLIIVYDGHNEFYGALSVASNQTSGSLRFLTLFYLRLVHLRTFQLPQNGIHKITALFSHKDNTIPNRTVMAEMAYGQYIPYENNIYNITYSIFHKNLIDLKDYCRSKGIPLILGTQVSNLRDQPPFISENSFGLSQQQRIVFQRFYKSGLELQSKGILDSATVFFRSAIAVDSLYADAHYHYAQCLDLTGNKHEALHQYILARDYDELRFRTDSRFNNLIRSMDDGKYCFVTEVEDACKSLSPDSLVGHNFITEHLHPSTWGNFVIGKCYAQVMRKYGLLATQQEWKSADMIDEKSLWQNRCVTDLDERMAAQSVNVITSGWPFKMQSPGLEFIPATDTLNWIAQRLAVGELGWLDSHKLAIAFYRQRGDWTNAEREYKTIISLYPHFIESYMELAEIYFRKRQFDNMKNVLLRSLQICPTLLAYNALGNIMMDKGNPIEALNYFEKMDDFLQSPEEKLDNGIAISRAYVKAGEYAKARVRLIQLLDKKPDFRPALELLAYVNKQMGVNSKPEN